MFSTVSRPPVVRLSSASADFFKKSLEPYGFRDFPFIQILQNAAKNQKKLRFILIKSIFKVQFCASKSV